MNLMFLPQTPIHRKKYDQTWLQAFTLLFPAPSGRHLQPGSPALSGLNNSREWVGVMVLKKSWVSQSGSSPHPPSKINIITRKRRVAKWNFKTQCKLLKLNKWKCQDFSQLQRFKAKSLYISFAEGQLKEWQLCSLDYKPNRVYNATRTQNKN